ncbi:MAG: helix-turn-helix transcriptional regulator [Clostridiales bacterium]|jgi:transcriptional regulator with XRE-family HTH domain|nr:helix-turn-helix transcriptional regulator [Clostridiales bacterium]
MNFYKIKEARKAAHFTQEQLADALGINRATLSKYETGEIEPSISQLQRIAQELHISPILLLPDFLIESWESGKEYGSDEIAQKILEYGYQISDDEQALVNMYWKLNALGRGTALERIKELTEIPRYVERK